MTLAELCEELGGLKENYVRNQWCFIKSNNARKGLYLYKLGRGKDAQYGIRRKGEEIVRWEATKKND